MCSGEIDIKPMSLLRRTLLTVSPVFCELRLPHKVLVLSTTHPKDILQISTDSNSGCDLIVIQPSTEVQSQETKVSRSRDFNPLSRLPPHVDRKYLDFPFFSDQYTFRHINERKAKVLYIMRGLPGSGKSTIVNLIKSSFHPSKLVVCSADDLFTGPDGTYRFDEKLLGVAHTECQQKAKRACEANTPVVVIDNTNVKRWEMKFYLSLGVTYGYVTVLVQPKTPWRMNPDELAVRNSHGVPLEALQRKVKTFDDVMPSYYGWFCSEEKSASLLRTSGQLLKECLAVFPEFRQDLLSTLGVKGRFVDDKTASGMLGKFYIRHNKSGPLLHCTAKFCARGKVPGSSSYHQREDVESACGRVFGICVSGFVFTRKTMGARVTLGPDAKPLFCKPEEREWGSPGKPALPPRGAEASPLLSKKKAKQAAKAEKKLRKKGRKSKGWEDEDEIQDEEARERDRSSVEANSLCWEDSHDGNADSRGSPPASSSSYDKSLSESMLAQLVLNSVSSKDRNERQECSDRGAKPRESLKGSAKALCLSERFPSLVFKGESRSAHLTLRAATGVESREVNFDLLRTCDLEQDFAERGEAPKLVPVSHGYACYYGDGVCCVYFDKPVALKTIFSGYY